MKRTAGLAALLMCCTVGIPAAAASKQPVIQVWEVVRVSGAPSRLELSLQAGFRNSRTMLAVTYLKRTPRGMVTLPGATVSSSEGRHDSVVYAHGRRVTCAPAAGAPCLPAETSGHAMKTVYYSDQGSADALAPDTVLVVTYGIDSSVNVVGGAGQWRVRRAANRAVRTVWSGDAGASHGAWTQRAGAEIFTSTSLPGGRRGSVAIGVPPCSGAVTARAGAGAATLSGGRAPARTQCPDQLTFPTQVAPGATTWRFDGAVVGASAALVSEPGLVRLVVVDF